MNKRLLNGVLLVLMVVIWGLVLNKYFPFFKSDNQNAVSIVEAKEPIMMEFSKDTFDLNKVLKDPFLGVTTKPKRTNSSTVKKKKVVIQKTKKKPIIKKSTKWPKFAYFGSIKGSGNRDKLVLVKINNKLMKIKQGDEVQDVLLKKVYRDSILIKMGKETKAVLKSK